MKKIMSKKRLRTYIDSLTPAQALTLGFLIVIIFGGFILYMPISHKSNTDVSAIDAIFTAASAVCVTGLVVVDTSTQWSSFGQMWILLLIQIGGIGFMTLLSVISMLLKKKIKLSEKLILQESLSQSSFADLYELVKNVLKVTLFIELIGAILLSFHFAPELGLAKGIWYGIFHSVSAFCNAGFDLLGIYTGEFSSLTSAFSNWSFIATIGVLIVLGGLGFPVIMDIITQKAFKKLSLHSKIVILTTITLLATGSLLILMFEWSNVNTLGTLNVNEKILGAIFQSTSTRTAGFNTFDLSNLRTASLLIMLMLMFIGASPASTGGGLKTTTFAITIMSILNTFLKKEDVTVFKKRVPKNIVSKAQVSTLLAILIVSAATVLLVTLESNISLESALFEVISAIATVGLSLGITSTLSVPSKILIIILMFLGRVGSTTVILALASRISSAKKSNIKYTEEHISL